MRKRGQSAGYRSPPRMITTWKGLFDKSLQACLPVRIFQLAKGLFLDLSNPFLGDIENFAYFLQGLSLMAIEAEPQPQDFFLSWLKGREQGTRDLGQLPVRALFDRGERPFVFDKVSQPLFVLPYGGLKGDRLSGQRQHHLHLFDRQLRTFRNFSRRRFAPQFLEQFVVDLEEKVLQLDEMHRQADCPRFVVDSANDALTDPPCRIRAEPVSLGVVEPADRFEQTEVSLLNQVIESHAPAPVPLGYAQDQSEVSPDHLLLGRVHSPHDCTNPGQ